VTPALRRTFACHQSAMAAAHVNNSRLCNNTTQSQTFQFSSIRTQLYTFYPSQRN